jgi:flagellar protein FliO/FliZ
VIRSLSVVVILALAAPAFAADEAPPAPAETAAEVAPAPTATPPAPEPKLDVNSLPPPSIGLGELLAPLFKTLLMLGVVLAIAYLTLHKGLGKLVARQNEGRRVKIVERVSLDPKRALYLVEIDGKQMLLGGSDTGVVHIKDLDAGDTAPALRGVPGEKNVRFADALEEKKTA